MDEYLPRLIDEKVEKYLAVFGAVSIVGPKWTGKTRTALNHAKSAYFLTATPGEPDPLAIAKLDSTIVFDGEKPRLIDEWQLMPEIWDMVRGDVDRRNEKGLYLLTGSSVPPQIKPGKAIHHSGAGRIGRLTMSTMTLFETGDSSGDVSLASLFNGESVSGTLRRITLAEIIHYIIRGGWPGNLGIEAVDVIPKDYLERIYEYEIRELGLKRLDLSKFRRFMYSLARNESTVCSISTLKSDMSYQEKDLDDGTVLKYLEILKDLFLITEQEAFSPDFRSRTRLKIGAKRHFSDPSLAAAIVGANEKNLLKDLRFLGFLFESLAEHDLRIYAEALGGKLYHYQDYNEDEVDAVIVLDDSRFALIEIKLGYEDVADKAAASLKKVADKLDRKPEFMALVSGTAPIPFRRPDGVYVIPLTSLKP